MTGYRAPTIRGASGSPIVCRSTVCSTASGLRRPPVSLAQGPWASRDRAAFALRQTASRRHTQTSHPFRHIGRARAPACVAASARSAGGCGLSQPATQYRSDWFGHSQTTIVPPMSQGRESCLAILTKLARKPESSSAGVSDSAMRMVARSVATIGARKRGATRAASPEKRSATTEARIPRP